MIVLKVDMVVKPGTEDKCVELIRILQEHSRKEPGCISHHVSIDADDPLTLHFTERWESMEALKAHFRVPESRAMWRRVQELAADPGAMHIYSAEQIRS